jgi:oxazoline/thiazoline synthase
MTPFPDRPVIRRDLHVEALPSGLVLIGETQRRVLSGRAFAAVARALNGRYDADQVAQAASAEVSPAEAWYALGQLLDNRLLVEAQAEVAAPEAAWWDAVGVEPAGTARKLAELCVQVESLGPDRNGLRRALAGMGVGDRVGEPDLRVVLTDDYLRPELGETNVDHVRMGVPWALARPIGTILWIGPIFRPRQSACWACMATRVRLNRQVEQFVLRKRGESGPLFKSPPALPSTEQLAADVLAIEIAKWVSGAACKIDGALLTIDTMTMTSRTHAVIRRPQCSVCGDPAKYAVARPVTIGCSPIRAAGDGGHRSTLPEETFARLAHHISPITGTVTWLENYVGHVADLIYSFTAGHNFVMGQDTLQWLNEGLRTRTGGKGVTEIQARVSAIGEAIERYSGVHRGDEPMVRSTRRALGEAALDLERCLNFSDAQYAARDEVNGRQQSILHRIPNRLEPATEIEWTHLWSLAEDRFRYLPAAYCWYGHPESREHFFCAGDTNGCASGGTPEEAILQAFLEVVERDAVAIWWYNRISRPSLDLSSFRLPYLDRLFDYYQRISRIFWVLDITADLGIPTFAAISRRTDRAVEDIVFGFGAHLDPKVALLRAVTEMNQFLPAVMRVDATGSTIYAWPEDDAILWWRQETVARQPWLLPAPNVASRRLRDFEYQFGDDIGKEVLGCVALCRQAGLDFLVQDQTRPDIGLHVARVVVPDMRHFWRRLGPGRLYEVPVKLGWLQRPSAEAELNPISVFI